MITAIKNRQALFLGDSLTHNSIYNVSPADMYPCVFRDWANAQTIPFLKSCNCGRSGDTSFQIMGRYTDWLSMASNPVFASVYGGANDPVNGLSQAQSQANIEAVCLALKWQAKGINYPILSVANPSSLPSSALGQYAVVTADNAATGGTNATITGAMTSGAAYPVTVWKCTVAATTGLAGWGRVGIGSVFVGSKNDLPAGVPIGTRMIVLSDDSTTGGAAADGIISLTAGLSGTVPGITVWECRYPQYAELGWGRIANGATLNPSLPYVAIIGQGYLNFTTGGDTQSVDYSNYVNVRAAALAASVAQGLPFVDLHAVMSALVGGGTVPDFSVVSYDATKSWHVANLNQHWNEYGHRIIAKALVDKVLATWPAIIKAIIPPVPGGQQNYDPYSITR